MMSLQTGKSIEDCRDYLRTGRCKYGASCKYNHSPNVQHGGGIKPMDPSEPLFPHRPDEPACQYYMKHGTCKFGQACKFHHPPQNMLRMMNGGGQGSLLMGMRSNEPTSQLVLNPPGNDNGVMLQFLPQRPDEPDCIYFLKNGRCKYGATCRYHHPVAQQQSRRVIENQSRRQQDLYSRKNVQTVQYVTQMIPSYSNQGSQVVMTSDNKPVTIINMDGSSNSGQSYQIVPGGDGMTSYCLPAGSVVVTEQGSSASSIASSSYETSAEHLGTPVRNTSAGSLNAYVSEGRQQRGFLPHSSSESNIQRRSRAASYGSAGDHSAGYYDSSACLRRTGSIGSWSQRLPGSQLPTRQDTSGRPPSVNNMHHRRGARQRGGRAGHDEGFTMMTSALLNMLDTPEEGPAESLSDEEYFQHDGEHHVDPSLFNRMSLQDRPPGLHESGSSNSRSYESPSIYHQRSQQAPSNNQLSASAASYKESSNSWSPTWAGATATPQSETTPHSLAMMHHHQSPSHGQPNDADVGLYLP